ncbi:MAG: VWA-like domain-containing protein [Burkholderiaceae bacterium]|nr:VWA-like domain-containing protein [Burkholderiaceae bacterium]
MPWEPGTTSARSVPRLALVIDVSGSIDAALLARFSTEVAAITRRQASETVLVIGDNTVQRVAHCAPGEVDLGRLELAGGGGTDFTPLLEEADRHRPDVIVVLTDLEGPARYTPRASVLWAVPETGRTMAAPFGQLLLLR